MPRLKRGMTSERVMPVPAALDHAAHGRILARRVRLAGEDDLAALDDVEPVGEIGHMVEVGFGDQTA